jgi:hypothetical protein
VDLLLSGVGRFQKPLLINTLCARHAAGAGHAGISDATAHEQAFSLAVRGCFFVKTKIGKPHENRDPSQCEIRTRRRRAEDGEPPRRSRLTWTHEESCG